MCGLRSMRRAIKPSLSGHRPADVDDVQCATGTQNAVNLGCRAGFHVVVQVVQHHRRQHPIEFAICERQLLRVCALEPNTGHSSRFSLRPSKGQRVRVGADHVGARLQRA